AELYSNFQMSRTDNLGFLLKHNSSQSGIKNVQFDDKFYNTSLDADYVSLQKDMSYSLNFNALHQLYNWYGIPFALANANSIDVQHSFFGVAAGGNIKFNHSVFSEGDVKLRYFGDSYNSSEINAVLQPKFSFNAAGQDIG